MADDSWMSKEYFEKILTKIQNGDLTIVVKEIDIKDALAKGENYGSKIHRVKIDYTFGAEGQSSLNLIVKAAFGDKQKQEMMEKVFFVFTREIAAYNDILPEVYRVLQESNIYEKIAPEMYDFCHNPNYLILEDLKANGYKLVDRKYGLDFAHLKLCLRKVAKFHACTATLYEQKPDLFSKHNYKNVNKRDTAFHGFMKGCLHQTALRAKTWNGLEELGQKLQNLETTIIDRAYKAFDNENLNFFVLNHGDLWSNNMMWKIDQDGLPTDCVLVDFAIGYVGSLGIDLTYLFFSSTCNDIKDREIDLLIQYYHENLVAVLKKVGYKGHIPSLLEIQYEFLKRAYYGIVFTCVLLPLRFLERTENADLNSLLDDTEEANEFRRQMFDSPKLEERLRFLLDFYDRKGLLN